MRILLGLILASIGLTPVRITNVSPAAGPLYGGTTVRITGSGFEAPVRVLFRTGEGEAEGIVISSSFTAVEVLSPAIDMNPEAAGRTADLVVVTRAGTPQEARTMVPAGYRFENPILGISGVSPGHAPLRGETHVEIFGDGFRQPVRVFFGSSEARLLSVGSDWIRVIAPPAERPGRVAVHVENITTGKSAVLPDGFRYVDPPAIVAVTPDRGPASGGTEVRISGGPFRAPVSVIADDVPLQVVSVSETEIVALTPPLATICTALTGELLVQSDGVLSYGPTFTYVPVIDPPAIVRTGSMVVEPGGEVEVELARAANVQFSAGGEPLEIVGHTGTTYRLRVPMNTGFPLRACITDGISGTRPGVSSRPLGIVDVDTGCRTDPADTLWLRPPQPAVCRLPPHVIVNEGCVRFPYGVRTRTITIANRDTAGTADLEISGATISGPFSIAPAHAVIAAGASATFVVTLHDENQRGRAEVVFTTNDRDQPLLRVCLTAPPRIRD
jgi:hypothetical protein